MRPCKLGHTAGRYKGGRCIACAKSVAQRWAETNRERRREIVRASDARRRERIRDKWHQRRDKYLVVKRAYAKTPGARYLDRAWRVANKEKIKAWSGQNRYRRRALDGHFRPSDIRALLVLQNGKCNCCQADLVKYHIDHVVPVARGGTDYPENLQLLCPACNWRKGDRFPHEFYGLDLLL